MTTLDGVRF